MIEYNFWKPKSVAVTTTMQHCYNVTTDGLLQSVAYLGSRKGGGQRGGQGGGQRGRPKGQG